MPNQFTGEPTWKDTLDDMWAIVKFGTIFIAGAYTIRGCHDANVLQNENNNRIYNERIYVSKRDSLDKTYLLSSDYIHKRDSIEKKYDVLQKK